jgi:hypothetical protein
MRLLVRRRWCCACVDIQTIFLAEEVHLAGGKDCLLEADFAIFSTSNAGTAIYLRQPCYTFIPARARQEHDCDSRAYIGALVRRMSGRKVTQSHVTKLITESRAECKCAHIVKQVRSGFRLGQCFRLAGQVSEHQHRQSLGCRNYCIPTRMLRTKHCHRHHIPLVRFDGSLLYHCYSSLFHPHPLLFCFDLASGLGNIILPIPPIPLQYLPVLGSKHPIFLQAQVSIHDPAVSPFQPVFCTIAARTCSNLRKQIDRRCHSCYMRQPLILIFMLA